MNILHFVVAVVLVLFEFGSQAKDESPSNQGNRPFQHLCEEDGQPGAIQNSTERTLGERRIKFAQQLFAKAIAASESDNLDQTATLFLRAYCASILDGASLAIRARYAANAIESALDARRIEESEAILLDVSKTESSRGGDADPEALLVELAHARLLPFQGHVETALELRIKLQPNIVKYFGSTSEQSATNRIRMSNLKLELGRTDEAYAELAQLKQDINSVVPLGWRTRILFVNAISSALTMKGREDDALTLLRPLHGELIRSFASDDERALAVDERIGEILIRTNQLDEALARCSRILLLRYKKAPADEAKRLKTLWQLALLYSENSRTESAQEIIRVIEKYFDAHPTRRTQTLYLQTLSLSATLDLRDGRNAEAREKWKTVYQAILNRNGSRALDAQIEATNLAIAMERMGQTNEACKLLGQTELNIQDSQSTDEWTYEYVRIARHSCDLMIASRENAEADLKALENAWEILSSRREPNDLDALNALGTYALALLRVGKTYDAKLMLTEFVRGAESRRNSAIPGAMTRNYALYHWVAAGGDLANPVAGYRELALLDAQDLELESALRISELARDRTLGDIFYEQSWRRERLPPVARLQLEGVLGRIQDLDERIAVTPDIVDRVRLEAERTLAVDERGALEREFRRRFHVAEEAARPPTLDMLRERLSRDTALVSVMHSSTTWWALVVTRDDPARFIDFRDPDLGMAASAWARRLHGEPVRVWPLPDGRLEAADAAPQGASGAYLSVDELGRRVANSLLSPLMPALQGTRRIVFVGDDELVGIPLQALPLASGLTLDRFDISYAPSLATYARGQGSGAGRSYSKELLAIGAVELPHLEPPETDNPIIAGVLFAADHPLRHAGEEIDGIASNYAPARVTKWTAAAASKSALREASRSGELARYRYVHFATHAWAQADRPESSAIVLGGAPGLPPTQLALTAAELAGLHMDSALIVLSACDTGAGRFEQGRGLLGLAYAGLAAGNRAELLTLWPVADDTSALFMQRFYGFLREGRAPARALAATQREFRHSTDPRLADAGVWAPFVLYGGD